jgi:hypothetical protein
MIELIARAGILQAYDRILAVVDGRTGAYSGQESRSPGHRAAPSMTVMDITMHRTFLPHDDPVASLAFYHVRPEEALVVPLHWRAWPGEDERDDRRAAASASGGYLAVDFRNSRSSVEPDNPDSELLFQE